jgi:hypothetical protein
MHELLLSNRDTILFTAPLVFMIFFAALRLDGKLALPQRSPSRRPTHQFDARGEIILTDPDGRPSGPHPRPRASRPLKIPRQTNQPVNNRKIDEFYYLDNKKGYL